MIVSPPGKRERTVRRIEWIPCRRNGKETCKAEFMAPRLESNEVCKLGIIQRRTLGRNLLLRGGLQVRVSIREQNQRNPTQLLLVFGPWACPVNDPLDLTLSRTLRERMHLLCRNYRCNQTIGLDTTTGGYRMRWQPEETTSALIQDIYTSENKRLTHNSRTHAYRKSKNKPEISLSIRMKLIRVQ